MSEKKLPEDAMWMAKGLKQALTQGIECWAEDTDRRAEWLHDNEEAWHVIAGTMLTGCFAYAEGKIGRFWWREMTSGAAKRDLDHLWIARNAFVHKDSQPDKLSSTNDADIEKLRDHCQKLADRDVFDDKGNAYEEYMSFDGTEIRFARDAINIIAELFLTAYRWSNK